MKFRPKLVAAMSVATATALVAVMVTSASAATLFSDDFNDGNANGWTKSGGSWAVAGGEYQQTGTGADAKAQAGSTSWTAQSVSARVRPLAFGNSSRSVGVQARAQNMTNFYSLVLTGSGSVQLRRTVGGGTTTLASAAIGSGTWFTLQLNASGASLSGSVNGVQLVSASDSALASGRAGLITSYASAAFDDVIVSDTVVTPPSSPTPTVSNSPPPPGTCNTSGAPTGFASVNAWGQNGTTGGTGGDRKSVV